MAKVTVLLLLLTINVVLVPSRSSRIPRQSHRPSFAGITGGNWENLVGQIIPPGTPWPAKAEDYSTTKSSLTTIPIKNQSTSTPRLDTSSATTPRPSVVLEYQPSRPSFAGTTAGASEKIPTKKPEGYTTSATTSTHEESSKAPNPHRPSFAGITGGNAANLGGQKIPTGTPWPAKPGDDSSAPTTSKYEVSKPSTVIVYDPLVPPFAGMSGGNYGGQKVPEKPESHSPSQPSVDLEYKPQRPSFAGITGGTWEGLVGQVMPSQNSSVAPAKDKLSFLPVSLNSDAIKAALVNISQSEGDNPTQLLVLVLNLKDLKVKPESGNQTEDVEKTEQFSATEKCNSDNVSEKNNILSVLLNAEGLKPVLGDRNFETENGDNV